VIGAVAINITLCSIHPRLRKWWRKAPMFAIGVALAAIEITLAITKPHALLFACVVLAIGLTLRQITKATARRRPKPSLLRQAIVEQLSEPAMARPRFLLATAGSATNAPGALEVARRENAALVVCFIRDVALSYKVDTGQTFTLDTDRAAQSLFREFLARGHQAGVPIIPAYDTGNNAAELIAEIAAMNAAEKVLIGTSRRGTLRQLIKGSFQCNLEKLLPPEIPVEVLNSGEPHATLLATAS
jgi:nucleotide-binding universal stress UspA family protein